MQAIRRVARYSQRCTCCGEQILKGDCVSVIPGNPATAHKKCEVELIAYEGDRKERLYGHG